jgi:hypothetical protein
MSDEEENKKIKEILEDINNTGTSCGSLKSFFFLFFSAVFFFFFFIIFYFDL